MMKRFLTFFGLVAIVALLLIGNTHKVFAQDNSLRSLKKPCCIAGTYKGFHEDIPSKTCNDRGKGEFTMVIVQEKNCGEKIKGTISDPTGSPMNFKGTIKPGPGKCCTLEGEASKPGETVKITAILCRKAMKWFSKDGKYVHSNGCKGTFKIKQI
jgi:hypothetical protein